MEHGKLRFITCRIRVQENRALVLHNDDTNCREMAQGLESQSFVVYGVD
jgi:hypothetical protein